MDKIKLNHNCKGCFKEIYINNFVKVKQGHYHVGCLIQRERLKLIDEVLDILKHNVLYPPQQSLNIYKKVEALKTTQLSPTGTKIVGVRAVGICSKCRQPGDNIIRDNKGKEIEDKDVACVNEAFGACKSQGAKE